MSETLRVVLVDDSQTALSQLKRHLAEYPGVEVVGQATDGLAGVTITAQRQPDLVLLDIIMPTLDGLAALRMIRAQCPRTRVAMISAVAGTASRAEEAFRLGAIQVLGKPLDADQLAALLEAECQSKRERTQADGQPLTATTSDEST